MMKFVVNHPMDFSNPTAAFSIALMQTVGGLGAAIGCILILCSINDLLGVITRFVALAMIAKIDDFYTAALPEEGNKIKKTTDPLITRIYRRHWTAATAASGSEIADASTSDPKVEENELVSNIQHKIQRFIYKTVRIFYASFIFYFLPYSSLFIPYCTLAKTLTEKE